MKALVFVRVDCPISNRYVPELNRIAVEFENRPIDFIAVYEGRAVTAVDIEHHQSAYGFHWNAVRDPDLRLATAAGAHVTPEAAVFDGQSRLMYHGRIDDRIPALGVSRATPLHHDLEDAVRAALAGKAIDPASTTAVGCDLTDLQ